MSETLMDAVEYKLKNCDNVNCVYNTQFKVIDTGILIYDKDTLENRVYLDFSIIDWVSYTLKPLDIKFE